MKIMRSLVIGAALMGAASVASAKLLVLGGNPPGSVWYAQAQALASVVSKHSDLRIDVLPQGSTVFYPMFQTEEVDMGLVSPIDAKFATQAQWPYEGVNGGKGYEMLALMQGSPIMLTLVTTKDSGINSPQDLKGKRVVLDFGSFAGTTITARAYLANVGLKPEDVEIVKVSNYPQGMRALAEGRADASFTTANSAIVREMDASVGIKLLGIDPSAEAMARAQKIGPGFVPIKVKAGSVPGISGDTHMLSYQTTVVARPGLDDKSIAKFIEATWNNQKELAAIHRSMTQWKPENFVNTDATIPFHPAAVKFYKAKGVWTDAMEKRQAELLKEYGR